MGKQPGVMLYFDIRPSLRRLTNEEKGQLFEAILDYGQYGVAPELEGGLGIAWDFIQPRLDRDRERYEEKVAKCVQSARRRWEKRDGADGCERMPTAEIKTKINTKSAPASASAPRRGGPAAERDFEALRRAALSRLEGAAISSAGSG